MIKAVVCDLDGTLLGPNHQISKFTCETIQKVRQKGIEVFIATGRHHLDADIFRDILGLDTYLISSNGAKVHNAQNEEVVSHNIDADLAAQVLDLAVHAKIRVNVYQNDLWFANKHSEFLVDFYKDSGFQCKIIDLKTLKGNEISKFFYIVNQSDQNELVRAEKILKRQFEQHLSFTYSLSNCLELLKYGVSKGSAVEELLKNHNILPSEAIAFGDGMNDYEMLSVVGQGLIMGNAVELKRSLPNHQVIGSNAEDGLAHFLVDNLNL